VRSRYLFKGKSGDMKTNSQGPECGGRGWGLLQRDGSWEPAHKIRELIIQIGRFVNDGKNWAKKQVGIKVLNWLECSKFYFSTSKGEKRRLNIAQDEEIKNAQGKISTFDRRKSRKKDLRQEPKRVRKIGGKQGSLNANTEGKGTKLAQNQKEKVQPFPSGGALTGQTGRNGGGQEV